MFEFLSSPFGLVAVGLGVLAVAVLGLCLWITTLDRRMRGMADGLEAERRKVAEMQMVIGRRNNAARSYGRRGGAAAPVAGRPAGAVPVQAAAPAPAPAQVASPSPSAPAAAPAAAPMGARGVVAGSGVRAGGPSPAADRDLRSQGVACGAPQARRMPPTAAATRRRGGGWAPQQPSAAADQAVDAWVQNGAGAPQSIVMPDKKMSRKARREAERAFAARAAAELEARQARRAQEVAAVSQGAPQRAAAPRPGAQPAARPYGAQAAPHRAATMSAASAAPAAPARGRHAR